MIDERNELETMTGDVVDEDEMGRDELNGLVEEEIEIGLGLMR